MQKFINNWAGTLLAPADAADEVLLVDTTGLPDLGEGEYLLLTLAGLRLGRETAWEIVRVTAIAEGELTVERAQEGTQALEWDTATPISARLTAGSLAALKQDTGWIEAEPGVGLENEYEIFARRRAGVVFLRGAIYLLPDDAGQVLATLPEGFRPDEQFVAVLVSDGGVAALAVIQTSGEITLEPASITVGDPPLYFSLSAAAFIA